MAFDPLDGSSIVDTNFTVGTIFGVYPGDKFLGKTGRDQARHNPLIFAPCHSVCVEHALAAHIIGTLLFAKQSLARTAVSMHAP